MTEFNLQIEKITGIATTDTEVGVFSRKITFEDGSVGTFVSCILTKDSQEQELSVFLSDLFEVAIKALEHMADGVLAALVSAKDADISYTEGKKFKASIIHTLFYKNTCYVVRFGDDVVLTVYEPGKSGEIKFESGSGVIKPSQVYVVSTRSFLEAFDISDFSKELEVDLVDIIDGLATQISAEENQSEIGAGFVYVSDPSKAQKEIPDDSEPETAVEAISDSSSVEEESQPKEADVVILADTAVVSDDLQAEQLREAPAKTDKKLNLNISSVISFVRKIISAILAEFSHLRRGDIRAILQLRKRIVLVAVFIVLILFGSVFYTSYQKKAKLKSTEVTIHLASANSKYKEALSILELNNEKARSDLIEADREVKLALDLDPKNADANQLKNDISSKLHASEGAASLAFNTYIDLGSDITTLSRADKNLLAAASNNLYLIFSETKKEEFAAGGNVSSAIFYSGNAFVLGDKVKKIELSTKKEKEVGTENSARKISIFFGNVYLLTSDGIRKYVPIESGYSGSDYLSSKQSFGDNANFVIDSSIWVSSGDKIYKFTRGEKESFDISGMVNTSYSFGPIYTNAEFDNLYVIDKLNGNLLVIDKKGIYKKSYHSDNFAKATGLVINEEQTKIYLSVGSKILEASL